MTPDLPSGRRGQLLALGLTLAVLGALWAGLATPLLEWHALRAEQVENRRALARRMAAIAETLPELRDQARLVSSSSGKMAGAVTLGGASDAIAGAALQGQLQEMTVRAGASLSSAEALPGEMAGGYRRIGVRVAVSAQWPVLVRLLRAVGEASPRMLVDDLQFRAGPLLLRTGPRPIDASFTVFAFRAPESASGAAVR